MTRVMSRFRAMASNKEKTVSVDVRFRRLYVDASTIRCRPAKSSGRATIIGGQAPLFRYGPLGAHANDRSNEPLPHDTPLIASTCPSLREEIRKETRDGMPDPDGAVTRVGPSGLRRRFRGLTRLLSLIHISEP